VHLLPLKATKCQIDLEWLYLYTLLVWVLLHQCKNAAAAAVRRKLYISNSRQHMVLAIVYF
jgi:hypothetical protein